MPNSTYKGRIRIRVNGLLVKDNALLMVRMRSPVTNQQVWMPPGGGLQFKESMEACLKREFLEETGLQVEVGDLRHINELLEPPFHAVEFYFDVTSQDDKQPTLGSDPEHRDEDQLIEELQFISFQQFEDLPVVPAYLSTNFLEDSTSSSGGVIFSSCTP